MNKLFLLAFVPLILMYFYIKEPELTNCQKLNRISLEYDSYIEGWIEQYLSKTDVLAMFDHNFIDGAQLEGRKKLQYIKFEFSKLMLTEKISSLSLIKVDEKWDDYSSSDLVSAVKIKSGRDSIYIIKNVEEFSKYKGIELEGEGRYQYFLECN
jgi:hypothetical protein